MKAEGDLGPALAVLRVIRGWTRGDLGRASAQPKELIAAYEEGRDVPELKTLERLLAALGFSLEDLQRARHFVTAVGLGAEMDRVELDLASEESELPPPRSSSLTEVELVWELEQAAAQMGRAVHRYGRVALIMLNRASRPRQAHEKRP